jgi:hypothetical protein
MDLSAKRMLYRLVQKHKAPTPSFFYPGDFPSQHHTLSCLTTSIDDVTMATTSQSGQLDEPPYPSYNELRRNGLPAKSTEDVGRLFWHFDGVFPTTISVMKTPRSPESLEPYCQPEAGVWHEISQSPLTEPKVSSVEASVYDLRLWLGAWLEQHREHSGGEYVTYGDLSDDERPYAPEMKEDGSWEEDSDTPYLVRCCGEDRPDNKTAKIVVTPSEGNHFVTVQDYVSGKSLNISISECSDSLVSCASLAYELA